MRRSRRESIVVPNTFAIAQLSRQPDRAAGIRAVLHLGPAVNRRRLIDTPGPPGLRPLIGTFQG